MKNSRGHCLFISSHLDDVAFSCSGILLEEVNQGKEVTLCTIFTDQQKPLSPFALSCQTDKGIPPAINYMLLRKQEDICFTNYVQANYLWLDFLEAPHRGYISSEDLFSGIHSSDLYTKDDLISALSKILKEESVNIVYAPAGIGNHVDHLLANQAVLSTMKFYEEIEYYLYEEIPYGFYREASPYLNAFPEIYIPITKWIDRKVESIKCYASQIRFQFDGAMSMENKIRAHALYSQHLTSETEFHERVWKVEM